MSVVIFDSNDPSLSFCPQHAHGLLVNRHDAEKIDHTLRDTLARQLLIAVKPSNTRTALNWESPALRLYVEGLADRSGLRVELDIDPNLRRLRLMPRENSVRHSLGG